MWNAHQVLEFCRKHGKLLRACSGISGTARVYPKRYTSTAQTALQIPVKAGSVFQLAAVPSPVHPTDRTSESAGMHDTICPTGPERLIRQLYHFKASKA